jgi:hypothetical protein
LGLCGDGRFFWVSQKFVPVIDARLKMLLLSMRCLEWARSKKVIEKLATTEKTMLAIAREEGGKIRVTSGSWDGEKVILKGQVLEVRNVDGRLYVSRKAKKPDEWDPPIPAYDPYGPGTGVAGDVDFVAGDETSVAGDAGA